ncbi:MAG TPA: sigma-70 family RNA polymerase sigma factor [Gemmatimonadaceae bacterium]|nr:sigma-70 family RNA polymerase sigma factor [Gemmatimonadaceae bacterium]
MSEPTALRALFLDNLAYIDRVIGVMARRQGLSGEDAADFASWTKLKLVEDDYAVLRKFRGESSIGTYLTVVIAMLARDYRVQRLGRWRPSAAARRAGALAVRLEVLVRRQGYRLDQAGEILRTAGETDLSDRELGAILARIPMRAPLRPVEVGAEPLARVEAGGGADALVEAASHDWERRRAQQALEDAMGALPAEDRTMLRMRFWEDMSVADIARGLAVEQKPLYRRLERLLAELRKKLAGAGVTAQQLHELLDESSV